MKPVNTLIIDLDAVSHWGDEIGKILKSSPKLSNKLHVKFTKPGDTSHFEKRLSGSIQQEAPALVFLILTFNHLRITRAIMQDLRREEISSSVVAVTDGLKPDEMLEMLDAGIDDFINIPFKPTDVIPRTWRLVEHRSMQNQLTVRLKQSLGLKQLVGESLPFIDEVKKIPTIAGCDSSVLISGETGTGKELCARAIHYLSPRARKPFVPFNCGAIPTELMENELFGHVQGAFTGASNAQRGLIGMADTGTLFLDDVDCLPSISQSKLLRFLQEKEYRRLGSSKIHHADVRVIAATNADLDAAVAEGKLRQDLYYRLNVIPITLPALRDRREDVPLLALHFLKRYASSFSKPITAFTSGAMMLLMLYEWPGNVRELEHVVERAVLFCEHKLIREKDISLPHKKAEARKLSFKEAKANMINKFERSYVERLLISHNGNITRAAAAAQKNRRAFWQLIRKHDINARSFKPN